MIKVNFDLDGTVFDLYGKENWLEMLEAENPDVFLGEWLSYINKTAFFDTIEKLLEKKVEFNVITWLPMGASKEFEEECAKVKTEWVKENMPFIKEISCISYGIPKQKAIKKRAKTMYLLDDNKEVCNMWNTETQRKSFNLSEDFDVVKALQAILATID